MDKTKIYIAKNYIHSSDGKESKRLSDAEVDVLKALLAAKGNVVSRDELMAIGWPGKVVVPNSLNMAILTIRRALEQFGLDDVIVTIPKVGFKIDKAEFFDFDSPSPVVEDVNEADFASTSVILKSENAFYSFDGKHISNNESKNFTIGFFKFRLVCSEILICVCVVFFHIFFSIQNILHRPMIQCDSLSGEVELCAVEISEQLRSAATEYMVRQGISKGEVWGEVNPHSLTGYKLYLVKK